MSISPGDISKKGHATQLVEENKMRLVWKGKLHEKAKYRLCNPSVLCEILCNCNVAECCFGSPCLTYCYWDEIKDRGYAYVFDNRIELNYPSVDCGCCSRRIHDETSVHYFDTMRVTNITRAAQCTPYHCCCCVECSGQVAAGSKRSFCNCCLCNNCRTFYPNLADAEGFSEAYNKSLRAYLEGRRLAAGELMAPSTQKM